MKRPDLYAVVGKPVLHSLSPVLMNTAFLKSGENAFYTRLRCLSGDEVMEAMLALGLRGINVTAPFKRELMRYVDFSDVSVKFTGALNTIVRQKGSLIGYNTDFIGVVNSFKERGIYLAGKRVLIIGAGGAASAAAFGMRQNFAHVRIINRTFQKARQLAAVFKVRAVPMEHLETEVRQADCIINTVGDNKIQIKQEWLNPKQRVLDANYKNSHLPQLAQRAGAQIIPGEKWLLNQAIPAYYIFRAKRPETFDMRDAITAHESAVPEKLVLFSDTAIDKNLLVQLEEKTGIEAKDGAKLDVFSDSTIYRLKKKYLKILIFSDYYAENTMQHSSAYAMLNYADLVIPGKLRKNHELSELIYGEISATFGL